MKKLSKCSTQVINGGVVSGLDKIHINPEIIGFSVLVAGAYTYLFQNNSECKTNEIIADFGSIYVFGALSAMMFAKQSGN